MCNKDREEAEVQKTKTELISNGNWYFTAYTAEPAIDYDGDCTKETDLLSAMQRATKIIFMYSMLLIQESLITEFKNAETNHRAFHTNGHLLKTKRR